jgi:hypothetical protein
VWCKGTNGVALAEEEEEEEEEDDPLLFVLAEGSFRPFNSIGGTLELLIWKVLFTNLLHNQSNTIF